jgi:hypothetical protein
MFDKVISEENNCLVHQTDPEVPNKHFQLYHNYNHLDILMENLSFHLLTLLKKKNYFNFIKLR